MFHTRNYRELTKLFFMFVLPALSSQLLSGIYTIVDGYFIAPYTITNYLAEFVKTAPVSVEHSAFESQFVSVRAIGSGQERFCDPAGCQFVHW